MATINPYLNFPGNAEEAFNFYQSVFGGDFMMLQRYSDVPGDVVVKKLSPDEGQKIMYIALPIGKENVLMATDALESTGRPLTTGNNFSISINAGSKEEAERIFNGLSSGGAITMPLADAFWGAYFGMFTDRFGIQWMVNFDYQSA